MRNLKKVITMTLAIAMMFGMTVMGTSAAVTFGDAADIENTTAVNMNVALNIINGDENGNFNPENTVTRAEMAKMISVALNGGVDPNTSVTNAVTFTDTAGHWASGYIENLTVQGIIAGYTDGSFAPNAGVTATEAAKMLLVALGYDAANEGFENDAQWSAKITAKANAKGLYTDLGSIDPAEALSRDDAAQMVWNALQADMVYYDYELGVDADGNFANLMIAKDYTYSILENKYSADPDGKEGTMTKFSYNSTKETYTYTVGGTSFTTEEDYTALYGHNVKVIYKTTDTSTVYGMFAEDSTVIFSGLVDGLDFNTACDSVEFDDVDYDVDATTTYMFTYGSTLSDVSVEGTYFNEYYDITAAADAAMDDTSGTGYDGAKAIAPYYTVDALDTTGDGDIDSFMVYPFTVAKATYVGSSYVTVGGEKYYFDDEVIYDDIAKSDYVKVTAAVNTATKVAVLEEVDETLTGKVTAQNGTDFYIGGETYQVADASVALEAGNTLNDAPVVNGFIFGGDTDSTYDVSDFAIVIGVAASATNGWDGDQAKLMFTDGSQIVVDTAENYESGATTFTAGDLVTYEVSNDEYTLTAYNTATDYGFDINGDGGIATDDDGATADDVYFLDGYDIADDAVIFVKDTTDDDYEVITGATLMGVTASSVASIVAYVADEDSSGFDTVVMAYITTAGFDTGDYYYGYIMSVTTALNDDDDKVYQYSIWTGDETITLITEDTTGTLLVVKQDLVKYSLNTDGEIDSIVAAANPVAISAASSSYITCAYGVDTAGYESTFTSTRYKLTDDTIYIYVDYADNEAIEDGSVETATTEDLTGDTTYGTGTLYYHNAKVIVTAPTDGSTPEVLAVMIDITNDMETYSFDMPTP